MRAVRVRSRHFNGRQPSGLGKYTQYFDCGMSLLRGGGGGGGGLMRGIKIPQYEFVLKIQGGLCARGSVFAGHYGTWNNKA